MDIRRQVVAAVAITIALSVPITATSKQERSRLLLHIANYAEVTHDNLARVQTEVEDILGAAGVTVAWVDTHEPGSISIMLLRITRDSQEDSSGCALGLALAASSRAYVFVNRIIKATSNGPVDLPVVIGRVIAHEAGHILMPHRPHSRSGIMRADLDAEYANPSRFNDQEVETIRNTLRGRARP